VDSPYRCHTVSAMSSLRTPRGGRIVARLAADRKTAKDSG